jgi:hypothetical protein
MDFSQRLVDTAFKPLTAMIVDLSKENKILAETLTAAMRMNANLAERVIAIERRLGTANAAPGDDGVAR